MQTESRINVVHNIKYKDVVSVPLTAFKGNNKISISIEMIFKSFLDAYHEDGVIEAINLICDYYIRIKAGSIGRYKITYFDSLNNEESDSFIIDSLCTDGMTLRTKTKTIFVKYIDLVSVDGISNYVRDFNKSNCNLFFSVVGYCDLVLSLANYADKEFLITTSDNNIHNIRILKITDSSLIVSGGSQLISQPSRGEGGGSMSKYSISLRNLNSFIISSVCADRYWIEEGKGQKNIIRYLDRKLTMLNSET